MASIANSIGMTEDNFYTKFTSVDTFNFGKSMVLLIVRVGIIVRGGKMFENVYKDGLKYQNKHVRGEKKIIVRSRLFKRREYVIYKYFVQDLKIAKTITSLHI